MSNQDQDLNDKINYILQRIDEIKNEGTEYYSKVLKQIEDMHHPMSTAELFNFLKELK